MDENMKLLLAEVKGLREEVSKLQMENVRYEESNEIYRQSIHHELSEIDQHLCRQDACLDGIINAIASMTDKIG